MTTLTALTADAAINAAAAASDICELVWWAQDEVGPDVEALLDSDRVQLAAASTAVDYAKARRCASAIRLSRRGRVALYTLHRLLPAYRRYCRATAGTVNA